MEELRRDFACSVYICFGGSISGILLVPILDSKRRNWSQIRNGYQTHWTNRISSPQQLRCQRIGWRQRLSRLFNGKFRCNLLCLRSHWYVLLESNEANKRWNEEFFICVIQCSLFHFNIFNYFTIELHWNRFHILLSSLYEIFVLMPAYEWNLAMVICNHLVWWGIHERQIQRKSLQTCFWRCYVVVCLTLYFYCYARQIYSNTIQIQFLSGYLSWSFWFLNSDIFFIWNFM